MNNWIRSVALAALLLGAATGIVACSDDEGEDVTLEEYFAAVDAIDNQTTEDIDALFANMSEPPSVDEMKDAFSQIGPILDQAAEDVADIDPPADVETEHDALQAELENFAAATSDASEAAADATTPEEFESLAFTDEYAAADEAFTTACLDLQQIAADNAIDVDLGCEDDEGEGGDPEGTIEAVASAWNAGDVDAVAVLFTDDGLHSTFGDDEAPATRDEIISGLAGEVGDGAIVIREISSEETETGADVTVVWASGRVLEHHRFSLVDDGGTWRIDADEWLPVEAPEDATVVNVDLSEFQFDFDPSQVTSDTYVVFEGHNVGTQPHHMVLAKIPADANLDELLMSDEEPPGVEEIGGGPPIAPGDSDTIPLAGPLEPGRYVMVCFLPDETDPEGTPHAFNGMVADFMVQ